MNENVKLYQGDCLEIMDKLIAEGVKVNSIITSPPYYAKRAYGISKQFGGKLDCEHTLKEIKTSRPNLSGGKTEKQSTNKGSFAVDYNDRNIYSHICTKCNAWIGELGQESTVEEYIGHLCEIFDKAKDILEEDGVLFVNIADTYIDKGKYRKGMYLVPERLKIEMQKRGWLCRSKIIWHVVNKMPLSLKDRFLDDYEDVIMFVKNAKYKFNQQYEKVDSGERIKRCVISTKNGANSSSNTASYPVEIINPLILASSNENDIILDPFMGSGTTGIAALNLNRRFIGIEISSEYYTLSKDRIHKVIQDKKQTTN